MTLAELLDGYAKVGVDVYVDATDTVRVRAATGLPPSVRDGLTAAVVAKLRHVGVDEVRAQLIALRTDAVHRLTT